jgi:hypothetical protein
MDIAQILTEIAGEAELRQEKYSAIKKYLNTCPLSIAFMSTPMVPVILTTL